MRSTPLARIFPSALYLLSVWCAATRPVAAADAARVGRKPISNVKGELGTLLRGWYVRGTAAGNAGDYYDNRDGGHSQLRTSLYPQLQMVTYSAEQKGRRLDWGGQRVIVPHVTFGNSSTASHATRGGCHTRRYYNSRRGLQFLFTQYARNNLYVYPEHTDHDPSHSANVPGWAYGDLFPANTPYIITSQGSSGTDKPFLRAIASTLAAFRPDVKQRLIKSGLLMPTLQMIFRISNKNLPGRESYLTGAAHPTVFVGANVDPLAMAKMAHAIRLDNIPPVISLKVVTEDEAVHGRDFFDLGKSEKLADTPCVIARVVRGRNYVRKIVVSAEGSKDLNERPLKYRWAVLRGDAARIKIKLLNKAGSVAELTVPYHRRRPISKGSAMTSNRVDIGVFVHNGTYYSAPGFVTFFSLDSEARTYDKDGRLLEIAYGAGSSYLRIEDWVAVIRKLRAKPATWATRALKKNFKPSELRVVAKIAQEYGRAASAVTAANKTYKSLLALYEKAAAAKKRAGEKRDAAAKAHKTAPTAATKLALTRAERAFKMAGEKATKLSKRRWRAKKPLTRAQQAANKLLDTKVPGRAATARTLITGAFERMAQDPLFVARNHKRINAAFQAASGPLKSAVTKTRKRLVKLGIISDAADFTFELRPARKGAEPAGQRLNQFERSMLEQLNKSVLANLVYPTVVKSFYRANYVEQILSRPKSWRDVYQYSDGGDLIGWARIADGQRTEFNADGLIVLARDASGRCIKARTVKYELAQPTKNSRTRWLQDVPGDEIVHYEYAGKDDWKGRVTRREPAPPR